MPEFSTTVKMNTLISTFRFWLHNYTAHLSDVLKLFQGFATHCNLLWIYVENIKSTNFIFSINTKSTNLRIHELVIFNQTTKIDAHEEKYFHNILDCNKIGSKLFEIIIKQEWYEKMNLSLYISSLGSDEYLKSYSSCSLRILHRKVCTHKSYILNGNSSSIACLPITVWTFTYRYGRLNKCFFDISSKYVCTLLFWLIILSKVYI
jgi:hypothetical protein